MSEQHTSVETTPQGFFSSLHERMESKKAKTLLVIGLGITALTGCAQQEAPHSSPSSSSAEASPTPTPSATEAAPNEHATPVFEMSELPVDLIETKNSSIDEFQQLPKVKQLEYLSWITQNETDFAKRFIQVGGQASDVLPVVSTQNTAEQIFTLYNYAHRLVEAYGSGDSVDADIVKKGISAIYNNPATSSSVAKTTAIMLGAARQDVDLQALNDSFASPKIVGESAPFKTRDGETAVTISYIHAGDNARLDTTFTYTEFTDYAGQPSAMWVASDPQPTPR